LRKKFKNSAKMPVCGCFVWPEAGSLWAVLKHLQNIFSKPSGFVPAFQIFLLTACPHCPVAPTRRGIGEFRALAFEAGFGSLACGDSVSSRFASIVGQDLSFLDSSPFTA
jgi:hypothetical protein